MEKVFFLSKVFFPFWILSFLAHLSGNREFKSYIPIKVMNEYMLMIEP